MYSVTEWLLRAAAGDQLVPAAGAVTSLLASAAAGNELAVEGLDCGQVVRAMLHAAATAKQAEALLLEPQWEADAGLVLLQGIRDMASLQELSHLLLGLAICCSDAAGWLLGVGLCWATTCHLDMGQQGSWFNEAGLWLLKAAVLASPRLAGEALERVLQQLTAEGSINTSLWQAVFASQQQQQRQQQQQPEQLAANHAQGVTSGSTRSRRSEGAAAAAAAGGAAAAAGQGTPSSTLKLLDAQLMQLALGPVLPAALVTYPAAAHALCALLQRAAFGAGRGGSCGQQQQQPD
ncbi:hypothetical protein OEZ86_007653 [Tetradesmus obliquus]|nr:hypothetical protein OEZ86_007653 [Tetradesmus obliquus]